MSQGFTFGDFTAEEWEKYFSNSLAQIGNIPPVEVKISLLDLFIIPTSGKLFLFLGLGYTHVTIFTHALVFDRSSRWFFFVSLRFSILQFLFNFNYSDDEERGDNFLGMYLILTNLSSREHPHSANNTILKIYIDI